MTELKLITYVPKNLEETKKTNLHVADHGYYKIAEDPDCAVRDFEEGTSHLKVEQTYDERPGEVKHIDPADYDGPQKSRKLEHYVKLNPKAKKKFVTEAWKKDNERFSMIEETCKDIVKHSLAINTSFFNKIDMSQRI